ncbi:MAG: hypothetical protein H6732_13330 [Alphaproteobacteria bacterium]|nr:hypothetical protein [Alphaproteobacteria bacterium]
MDPHLRHTARVATIHGIPVHVGWSTLVVAVAIALLGPFAPAQDTLNAVAYLLIVGVHEAGHAWVVRRRGHHVDAITVHMTHGACMYHGIDVTPLDRALIAWGGVAAQALLAIAASVPLAVFGHVPVLEVLVVINLSIAAFNLLPFPGRDGEDAWTLFRLLEEQGATRAWAKRHRDRPRHR